MTERPILFKPELVTAIMAGRKTQTRRVLEPQPDYFLNRVEGRPVTIHDDGHAYVVVLPDGSSKDITCPYGAPGDRLWVRETWAEAQTHGFDPNGGEQWGSKIVYRADGDEEAVCDGDPLNEGRWRPSIHMHRWDCRLRLDITEVRVERVQEISHEDIRAEGIYWPKAVVLEPQRNYKRFTETWDAIHGDGAWDSNPWVWCIGFKRAEGDGG